MLSTFYSYRMCTYRYKFILTFCIYFVCASLSLHSQMSTQFINEVEAVSTVKALLSLIEEEASDGSANFSLVDMGIRPGGFQAMRFLDILNLLSIQKGYRLDYVYLSSGSAGEPYVIALSERQDILVEVFSYDDEIPYDEALKHLLLSDTAESYFQLALFQMVRNGFYVSWHAMLNYKYPVIDNNLLKRILVNMESSVALTLEQRLPKVVFKSDTVSVSVLAFKQFGFSGETGIIRVTYKFNRGFPHVCVDETYEMIVPYSSGIRM
jgi:hypothetical protein